jgi:hypothetical protein
VLINQHILIICLLCSNWKFVSPVKGRLPNGIITILLKKYWPGMFNPKPNVTPRCEERVLATTWAHYKVAELAGLDEPGDDDTVITCAEAVRRGFWVSFFRSALVKYCVHFVHSSRPFWLTHDLFHSGYMHDCRQYLELQRSTRPKPMRSSRRLRRLRSVM